MADPIAGTWQIPRTGHLSPSARAAAVAAPAAAGLGNHRLADTLP